MSNKPKYFYNLSIYDPVVNKDHSWKTAESQRPSGWYFPIGIGKHVLSFLESTKTTGKNLTTKGSDLLDYASSLEGTVKIGFIASCTCAGGLVSLLIRPKGRIRKLFYPSLFLASSSAICYPSNAYIVAKTGLVYAYSGSESMYDISKQGIEKISEWRSVRKIRQEQAASQQQPIHVDMTVETMSAQDSQEADIAPFKVCEIRFQFIYNSLPIECNRSTVLLSSGLNV